MCAAVYRAQPGAPNLAKMCRQLENQYHHLATRPGQKEKVQWVYTPMLGSLADASASGKNGALVQYQHI